MPRYERLAAENAGCARPIVRDPPRKLLMLCTIHSCDEFVNDSAEKSEDIVEKTHTARCGRETTPKTTSYGASSCGPCMWFLAAKLAKYPHPGPEVRASQSLSPRVVGQQRHWPITGKRQRVQTATLLTIGKAMSQENSREPTASGAKTRHPSTFRELLAPGYWTLLS
jgi:hypothetical protein